MITRDVLDRDFALLRQYEAACAALRARRAPRIGGGSRRAEEQVLQWIPNMGQANDRQKLPLGVTVARYHCRFTGTLTVGTNAVTPFADSPYGVFHRIQLILNGGKPLRVAEGRFNKWLNNVQHGVSEPFTVPNGTGGAATAIKAEFDIDLEQDDLLAPNDRAFWMDTRLLSALDLSIDWGGVNDIVPANTGGIANTLTSPQMTVTAEEITDAGGPSSQLQQTEQQASVAATGNLDIQIPALGPAYRGLAIFARSGNADPNLGNWDDTVVSTVSLIGDNTVRYMDQVAWAQLQSMNQVRYTPQGGTWQAGSALIDFARDGTLRDLLLTAARKQLVLRLNIGSVANGNVWILVYPLNDVLVLAAPPQAQRRVAAGARGAGVTRRGLVAARV